MGQDHSHHHHSTGNIRAAFFLNFAFTILEIIGGFWTNSVAILSDAIHDFGDSLSLALAWYLEKKSEKKGDSRFTFGYRRFSLLGALINGLILIAGSAFILNETIPRIMDPEETNAQGMLLFALLGIAVNGAAVWRLGKGQSMNARMVRWHLFEDVLGWVAVLIVSVILLIWDVPILDPLLSVLILAYVLYNVFQNLKTTLNLFLQAVPEDVDLEQLKGDIQTIKKVADVRHAHVWSMDGEHHVLSIHLVIDHADSVEELINIKKQAQGMIKKTGITHATIELELSEEDCFMLDDNC